MTHEDDRSTKETFCAFIFLVPCFFIENLSRQIPSQVSAARSIHLKIIHLQVIHRQPSKLSPCSHLKLKLEFIPAQHLSGCWKTFFAHFSLLHLFRLEMHFLSFLGWRLGTYAIRICGPVYRYLLCIESQASLYYWPILQAKFNVPINQLVNCIVNMIAQSQIVV